MISLQEIDFNQEILAERQKDIDNIEKFILIISRLCYNLKDLAIFASKEIK